jgi:hypothetical protein
MDPLFEEYPWTAAGTRFALAHFAESAPNLVRTIDALRAGVTSGKG